MKFKILIVEDDSVLRDMYSFKLIREDFEVETAIDGLDGLKKSEDFLPDAILLDLSLPLMNGDEMLQKVREQPWGSSMRVLVLTNLNRREAPMSLMVLNVSRYIVKAHTTPNQIVQILKEVLNIKHRK